jgi:hypothetical protein
MGKKQDKISFRDIKWENSKDLSSTLTLVKTVNENLSIHRIMESFFAHQCLELGCQIVRGVSS